MKKIYLLLTSIVISSAGVAQTRYIDPIFTSVNVQNDVIYGTGRLESGSTQDLRCDIYTPAGDTKTDRPLIIAGHGGSFIADYGDKSDAYLIDFATLMAKKGYVVAAITYREGWAFSPLNSQEQNARAVLPAVWRAIQDFKTSVRFFKKSAVEGGNPYGIDPKLVIGGGFGAGGYLPLNGMLLDSPSDVMLPELQQKDAFGDPNGIPYIDTNKVDLGGIYSTAGGSPGYSYRVELVLNYSGAIATLKEFDQGENPLVISVHSEDDEATPYKSGTVKAASIFDVIDVHGSYVVTNELYNREINNFWLPENRDGLPQAQIPDNTNGPIKMYERGLYTLLNQPYLWSNTVDVYTYNYSSPGSTPFMDTVTTFSAYRIEKWLREKKGIGIDEINFKTNDGSIKIFPNPASDKLTMVSIDPKERIREVEFTDMNGKLVKHSIVIKDADFDISSLSPGIYSVKIYLDNTVITDKIVVK